MNTVGGQQAIHMPHLVHRCVLVASMVFYKSRTITLQTHTTVLPNTDTCPAHHRPTTPRPGFTARSTHSHGLPGPDEHWSQLNNVCSKDFILEQRPSFMLWTDINPHLNNILLTYMWSSTLHPQPLSLQTTSPTSMYPSPCPTNVTDTAIGQAPTPPPHTPRLSHRVQHEAVDPTGHGQHQHGGTAIEGIASCHQVPAGLQGVLLRRLVGRVLGQEKTKHIFVLLCCSFFFFQFNH